ncbi:MAG: TonB-dependent receptor domain-containing protein [Acidobacteriota bacterium]
MSNRRFKCMIGAGAVLFYLAASVVFGQVETARITGIVSDASGAVIPGVEITITHLETNRQILAVTDDEGRYQSVALPVGNYRVSAELPGFKRFVRSGIRLRVQDVAMVDFTLEVGEVTEEVQVVASAPVLNTAEGSQGQVIDNKRIIDMPLNGRDYIQLALLSAGAVQPVGGRAGGFSTGGQRTTQNNYILDGVDNNSVELATAGRRAEMVKPSIDAIQEFKVQTNAYSAEFGHGTGGVINVTTKSGSNGFHGTVYEFHRNDVLDAKNFFDPADEDKPPFKRNQFGFSFGGPIIKDQTFFFGDYEGTRIRESRTVVSTIPTLKMRTGDFSEIEDTIFNPATFNPEDRTRQPFPGNVIPAEQIDPLALKLINLYPEPQNNNLSDNFVFNPPSIEDVDKFDIRLDHLFSQSDNIYYRLSFHDDIFPASLNLPAPAFGGGAFDGTVRGWNTGLVWNHVFSPGLITSNRVAWNFAGFTRANPAEAGQENLSAQLGIQGVDHTIPGGMSQFGISGYRALGLPSFNGVSRNSQNRQFISDTTWIRGSHNLKFGVNILRTQNNIFNVRNINGQFSFNGRFTRNPNTGQDGDPMADFLLGLSSGFLSSTPIIVNLRGWLHGIYLQDDWHVTPDLTLNLGLRYELALPYQDKEDRMTQFDLDSAPDNPRLIPAGTEGEGRFRRSLVATDTNNFGPRISFAYQIMPQTVIRGGYGIFYGYLEPSGDAENLMGNPPHALGVVLTTDGITPAFLLVDGPPPDILTIEKASSLRFSSFETRPSSDYSQQWNLSIQRQLGQDWLLEVGYFAAKGNHILRRIQGNPAPPGPGNINARRRHKSIAIPGSDVVVSPLGPTFRHEWSGNSIYHSMQSKVEKRFSSGFTILGSYLWSRSIGDTCGFAGSGNAGGCGFQDSNNLRAERSLDNQHIAHRFVTSSIWELPFGRSRRWGSSWNSMAEVILGGWSLSGIVTFSSGAPYSILVNGDPANTGDINRPNLVGNPNLDDRAIDRYFNTEAFEPNQQFTFGNLGRNTMIGPSFQHLDLAALKSFQVTEDVRVQFRFEAFNATNTPHFNLPGNNLGTRNFGRITGAGRPRNLQFGLKIIF